ncbi:hypothetical protein A1O3_08068 [Capronia epimyces CBS 606.96]|uniref:Zn(2)-C6 fungal-type domain-containing protein n=1 Tax=Capronia epimyces CBS 606.96 TaxID=1182542 RepID=W9YBP9_9EURO|nr:uncharacterized protein A1O3_08068 [Capronia epimyces CBS 606.96]EXJ79784.1 hypothetical protein A1O3_08068 [Capronia epimyces CBS 606.96]
MSNRRDRADGYEQSKSRVRIGRACDRCKLKKSKCDGNTPCSSCVVSDSTCEYSVRRRREARDWYWGMQDVMDEALQRLYWACRENRGFPGIIPDESSGRVSTDAILRGLGLSPPPVERLGLGTTQSDSALDVGRGSERLYQPPDIQSDRTSRTSTSSSKPTPISMVREGRLVMGERVPVPEGPGLQPQISPTQAQPGCELPSLPPQMSEAVDGSMDPAMLQDADLALMNLDRAMYPEAMHFQPGEQLAQHDRRTPPQIDHTPLQTQNSQEAGIVPSQGAEWEGQRELQGAGMLPWPGTLAAVYRGTKLKPDGTSFHIPSPQQ